MSSCICAIANHRISIFFPYFLSYPLRHWWPLRLIPHADLVNNAVINIEAQAPVRYADFITFDIFPLVAWLHSCASCIWNFWGTAIVFSMMTMLTNTEQRFPVSTPSLPLFIFCPFDYSHSNRCQVISHLFPPSFICIPLMISDNEQFASICLPCVSSLEKCLLRFSCYLLPFSCLSSLCILDTNFLRDVWLETTFSHSICCIFYSVNYFLCCA
jgi:hypothetical protein